MKYAFVCKDEKSSKLIKQTLVEKLVGKEDNDNPDFVFTIGGDGTVLDAVRKYIKIIEKVIFVTIHTGNLGFYTEFLPKDIDQIIASLNDVKINKYHLLKYRINNEEVFALNEITITDQHRLLEADVYINDVYLMHTRGNGICLSTPTGSTAYNKSIGGAVLNPFMEAIQLSLIAPFESVNFPMLTPVVLGKEVIKIKPKNKYIDLTSDREWISKENVLEIIISLADKQVSFLENTNNNFIKRLNEKFIGK